MLAAAALLLASTLHAGPEIAVSEAVRETQPYVQVVRAVAAGDDSALVVWQEGVVLRGARVDRRGNTLDAVPLLIAYAPWEGAWVARGATNWLVVAAGPDRIEATIVGDDGTVGQPVVIATTIGIPRVAFDGISYLVTWYDAGRQARIFGTRISSSGQVDDGQPFMIGEGFSVEVATDGHDFLVTWHNSGSLSFRRVLRDGTMPDPARTIPAMTTGPSCITSIGSDYVLGYLTFGSFVRPHIRAMWTQRVTRGGELSGEPVLLNPTTTPNGVACASTGTTALFTWWDAEGRVRGATLSAGGPSGRFEIGTGTSVSVATHGDGFLVAWPEYPAGRVSWATVSEGGTAGLPHTIEAQGIEAASRPGGYLLLYGMDPLRARPLDAHGDPSGPELVIASDASAPAFAGGTLVYQRDTDILPQPRWRVFLRELDETGGRRRVSRH